MYAVVSSRGGERGTCLGHPLQVLRTQICLIFDEKRIIHSYNVLQSRSYASTLLSTAPHSETAMCTYFAFKGPPKRH